MVTDGYIPPAHSSSGFDCTYTIYHTTSTDTCASYDYLYSFSRASRPQNPLDERKSPKAWARWFREFLLERLRLPKDELLRGHETSFRLYVQQIRPVARNAPLPLREWKMKDWVQALRAA